MVKMFSSCAGKCDDCVIHFTGGCIAGHGDDDYSKITIKQARELIEKGNLSKHVVCELHQLFPQLDNKLINSPLEFAEWIDINCIRAGEHEWTYRGDNYTKKHTTEEIFNIWNDEIL